MNVWIITAILILIPGILALAASSKARTLTGGALGGAWNKYTKDLLLIALVIIALNAIWGVSWHPTWLRFWKEHSAFFVINIAIILGFFVILVTQNKIAKTISTLAIAMALIGCLSIVLRTRPKTSEANVSSAPPTQTLIAGTWTAFEVVHNLTIDTQPGIPFKARINDGIKEISSGPNGELIDLPPSPRVERIWIKPERDMVVTLHYRR